MKYRGITAKQAYSILGNWIEDIKSKTVTLGKGARFYLWMFYMSLPVMGITKVLTGSLGVSLMSHKEGDEPLITDFVAGLIILVAVVIDTVVTLIREGVNSRQKSADCSSVKKRYEMLVEIMEIKLKEIENNLGNISPDEALMKEIENISRQEDMVKLDEPGFVWIGHNSSKVIKAAENILEGIQANGGIIHHIEDMAGNEEKMGLAAEILKSDLTHEAIKRLTDKLLKYSYEQV